EHGAGRVRAGRGDHAGRQVEPDDRRGGGAGRGGADEPAGGAGGGEGPSRGGAPGRRRGQRRPARVVGERARGAVVVVRRPSIKAVRERREGGGHRTVLPRPARARRLIELHESAPEAWRIWRSAHVRPISGDQAMVTSDQSSPSRFTTIASWVVR